MNLDNMSLKNININTLDEEAVSAESDDYEEEYFTNNIISKKTIRDMYRHSIEKNLAARRVSG